MMDFCTINLSLNYWLDHAIPINRISNLSHNQKIRQKRVKMERSQSSISQLIKGHFGACCTGIGDSWVA
jgi:hypothetical protein